MDSLTNQNFLTYTILNGIKITYMFNDKDIKNDMTKCQFEYL